MSVESNCTVVVLLNISTETNISYGGQHFYHSASAVDQLDKQVIFLELKLSLIINVIILFYKIKYCQMKKTVVLLYAMFLHRMQVLPLEVKIVLICYLLQMNHSLKKVIFLELELITFLFKKLYFY